MGFALSGSHGKGKVTPSCQRDLGSSDPATCRRVPGAVRVRLTLQGIGQDAGELGGSSQSPAVGLFFLSRSALLVLGVPGPGEPDLLGKPRALCPRRLSCTCLALSHRK